MARPPLVALESTIIAHGMPYPRNVETALAVEAIVRPAGAKLSKQTRARPVDELDPPDALRRALAFLKLRAATLEEAQPEWSARWPAHP